MREVEPLLREYVELVREESGGDSREYVAALNELGSLLRALKAARRLGRGLPPGREDRGGARGTDNADYATTINNLAGTYRLRGDFEKAEALFREAMGIYESRWAPSISSISACSTIWTRLSGSEEARRRGGVAPPGSRGAGEEGREGVVRATTLNNLAAVAMATGRHEEARHIFEETLRTTSRPTGRVRALPHRAQQPGGTRLHHGRLRRAADGFAEALAIIEGVLGAEHPDWAKTKKHLAWPRRSWLVPGRRRPSR